MVKMIATKTQTYDLRTIKEGEEFEVADQFVATLQSLGRARPKDQKSSKTEPMKTEPAKTEPVKTKAAEEDNDKKYKTRHLKAEDSK